MITPGSIYDMRQTTSVSLLREFFPWRNNGVCILLGYSELGDGGEGYFRYDESSIETPDGGIIIEANGGGRWKRLFSGSVNVKWFGAKGDGVSDDSEAFQKAIDYWKGTRQILHQDLDKAGEIFVPAGTYIIGTRLCVYAGIKIKGTGPTSIIKQSPVYNYSELILLKEISLSSPRVSDVEVKNIKFESTTPGVAAIAPSNTNGFIVVNSNFEKIYLKTTYGIKLNTYTQATTIKDIYSSGNIDVILELAGNANIVDNIDKEGSGTSLLNTNPYIILKRHAIGSYSSGNVLRNIIVEGTGAPGKTILRLEHCYDTTIENLWCEVIVTGTINNIEIYECDAIAFRRKLKNMNSERLINVQRSRRITFENLALPSDSSPISSFLIVDKYSDVKIQYCESKYGQEDYSLNRFGKEIDIDINNIDQIYDDAMSEVSPVKGYDWRKRVRYQSSGNLFTNGSFQQGENYWFHTLSASVEFIQSEVAPGLMAHYYGFPDSGNPKIYQKITIPPGMAIADSGRALTLTALVKIVGPGYIYAGLGACVSAEKLYYNQITESAGWSILSQTFYPQASGEQWIGIRLRGQDATTHLYIDEANLSIGNVGALNSAQFGSIELGKTPKSITYASTMPVSTVGYSQGDIVFNSAPIPGGYTGWQCILNGAVLEWRGFALIAP